MEKSTVIILACNEYGWWYVVNGAVDFNYYGIGMNELGLWFYNNGTISWNYTGSIEWNGVHSAGDWQVVTEATTSSTGLKAKYCTRCGTQLETEAIPKLENHGQETAWSYNGNTRTKILYDGTTLTEQQYSIDGETVWGYFDRGAATSMIDYINKYRTGHQGLTYCKGCKY